MFTKEGTEPLEDIRVEVMKVKTYFVGNQPVIEDERTGLRVRMSRNLDNYKDSDGNTQYLKQGETPKTGVVEHRGITQLKAGVYAGQYVITQEILKTGEKRRKSKRKAILVTDAEALDYIIFADKLYILELTRFAPLKALYYRSQEPIDWSNVEPPENVEKYFHECKGGDFK